MTKHIAASGAQAGQWVTCPAKIQCTLTTTIHASDEDIEKTRIWKQSKDTYGRKALLKDLTEQDYTQYLQLPQEDKDTYTEIFQYQQVDKQRAHEKAVAATLATKSVLNTKEQNPPKRLRSKEKRKPQRYEKTDKGDTIIMENGLIVEKANYTPEQKQKAEQNVEKISTILGKWDVAGLSQKELKDFSDYAKNAKLFGANLFTKETHKIVMDGLKTKSQSLTQETLKKFQNAATILEQIQYANMDIIRGYKVGSYHSYIKSVQDPKNWVLPKKKKKFLSRFLP